MNRRQFLGLAAFGAGGALSGWQKLFPQANSPNTKLPATRLYSATNTLEDSHFLTELDITTGKTRSQVLPWRGHALVPVANGKILLIGRRPAFQCAVVDFALQQLHTFNATLERHFEGHACWSATDDVLFTTENDYGNARGVIGIRDRQTWQPVGEYPTYGIGAHDLHLMPDGKTLVVANGGIQTHPDFGRRPLNLDTMQPSLVYIDAATGKKLDEYRLPDRFLSIRHLIVTAQGDIGVALQYEGDLYRNQPASLVAWQAYNQELRLLPIDKEQVSAFKGYMADLAWAPQRQLLAVTSPRGGHVTFWDTQEQRFLSSCVLPEPSGIVYQADAATFLVSDTSGGIYQFSANQQPASANLLYQIPTLQWDNHMIMT